MKRLCQKRNDIVANHHHRRNAPEMSMMIVGHRVSQMVMIGRDHHVHHRQDYQEIGDKVYHGPDIHHRHVGGEEADRGPAVQIHDKGNSLYLIKQQKCFSFVLIRIAKCCFAAHRHQINVHVTVQFVILHKDLQFHQHQASTSHQVQIVKVIHQTIHQHHRNGLNNLP